MKNKRKNVESKNKKKVNLQEEKKIKRIKETIETTQKSEKNTNKSKEDVIYDLWETNPNKSSKISIEPLKYPKLIIPHPGQSYNPNREDLKNLLQTIVDNNKPKVNIAVEPISTLQLQEGKFEISEDEVEENQGDIKISNNPPVMDENRLSRRERNKMVRNNLKLAQK